MLMRDGKERAELIKCENCGKIGACNYFCMACWASVWEAYYYTLEENDDIGKFLKRREEALILRRVEQHYHDSPATQCVQTKESVIRKLTRCFTRNRGTKNKADFQERKNGRVKAV